jgi:nucleoside-diphosphate kinase
MGKTFGFEAEPGTIRGDFGMSKTFNLIHGSDSPQSAASEIALYFKPEEMLEYAPVTDAWTNKPGEA